MPASRRRSIPVGCRRSIPVGRRRSIPVDAGEPPALHSSRLPALHSVGKEQKPLSYTLKGIASSLNLFFVPLKA
jgi:hypothetical protein